MYGGEAIAAGSQGCIFLPKLAITKEANGRSHARNSKNTTKITKIFFDEHTYENEEDILRRVREITGGVGVIDYEATLLDPKIDVLHSPIPVKFQSACQVIRQALAANRPVYAFHQTKVLGSIDQLPNNSRPIAFFKLGFEALLKLVVNNIVHLDIAPRNVFYTETNAIIGDFGYGFDMGIDSQFDKNLDRFYDKQMISAATTTPAQKILDSFSLTRDSISYEASFAMYFYKAWGQKKELLDAFFNDRDVKDTINELYKPFIDDYEPGYLEKITALLGFIRDAINTKDDMKALLKNILRHSDLQIYIRSILSTLNISKADKKQLRVKCVVNNNYDFFYELLQEKPGEEIVSKLSLLESNFLYTETEQAMSAAESGARYRMALFPYRPVNTWPFPGAPVPSVTPALMGHYNGNLNRQLGELNDLTLGNLNPFGDKKRKSRRNTRKQRKTRKH